MGVSKVDFGDETLIDLTGDTVNENNLLAGATAHGADGEPITGSVVTHDVVDNLTSTSTTDALSANQGRILNTTKKTVLQATNDTFDDVVAGANDLDLIINEDQNGVPFGDSRVEVIDNLVSTARTKALSANMGRELKEDVDELNTNLVNNTVMLDYDKMVTTNLTPNTSVTNTPSANCMYVAECASNGNNSTVYILDTTTNARLAICHSSYNNQGLGCNTIVPKNRTVTIGTEGTVTNCKFHYIPFA